MKRLLLLRHAKAEVEPSAKDHARPLAPRGELDVPLIAAAMREADYIPSLVLCSTALRTRQTVALSAKILGDPVVLFEDGLYLASWKAILRRLRELDDNISTVMVAGHNPGLADLAAALAGGTPGPGEAGRRERLTTKFPTCALAVLDAPVSHWRELSPASSALTDLIFPKSL